jgi:dTDP-4-dehydrorhamnose reductase
MNILITGGNGYIAKSLCTALKNQYNVTCITRQDFDLTNYAQTSKWFENKYFDVVIHTAVVGGSRLREDNATVTDQNLMMYYNLISHKNQFDKFIHFGSGAELLMNDKPYGLSKRIIRESILLKERCYNIRIYGVFDENELDTRFIKTNIKRYINKEPILVQDKKMSFFYMQDLITLVKYHITTDPYKLIPESNCAYLESMSLFNIANIINELDHHKVPIYIDAQPSSDYESNYNAPYNLKYVGLKQGIINTYNKLKNEY